MQAQQAQQAEQAKQATSLPSMDELVQPSMPTCRLAFEYALQHESTPAFEVHARYGVKSRRKFATFVTEVPIHANLVRSNTVVQRISAPFDFALIGSKSLRATFDASSNEYVLDESLLVCLCAYSEVTAAPLAKDEHQGWKLRVVYECLPREQVDGLAKKEAWQVTSRGTVIKFKHGEVWPAYVERTVHPYVQHNLPEFLPGLWAYDKQELLKAYAQFLAMPTRIRTATPLEVGHLLVEAWTNSFKNKSFGELAPFWVDKSTHDVVPLGVHAKLWFEFQVDHRGTKIADTTCDAALVFYSKDEFRVTNNMVVMHAVKPDNLFRVETSLWETNANPVRIVADKPCKVAVLCEFLTKRARKVLRDLRIVASLDSNGCIEFKATNLEPNKQVLSNLLCSASDVTQGKTWSS